MFTTLEQIEEIESVILLSRRKKPSLWSSASPFWVSALAFKQQHAFVVFLQPLQNEFPKEGDSLLLHTHNISRQEHGPLQMNTLKQEAGRRCQHQYQRESY